MKNTQLMTRNAALENSLANLVDSTQSMSAGIALLLKGLLLFPQANMVRARSSLLFSMLPELDNQDAAVNLAVSIECSNLAVNIHRRKGLGVDAAWLNLLDIGEQVSGERILIGNYMLSRSAEYASFVDNIPVVRQGAISLASMLKGGISVTDEQASDQVPTPEYYISSLRDIVIPLFLYAGEGAILLSNQFSEEERNAILAFSEEFAVFQHLAKELHYLAWERNGSAFFTSAAWSRGLATYPLIIAYQLATGAAQDQMNTFLAAQTEENARSLLAAVNWQPITASIQQELNRRAEQLKGIAAPSLPANVTERLTELIALVLQGATF